MHRITATAGALAVVTMLAGCVPASAVGPVAAHQSAALTNLDAAHERDRALVRALTDAHLAARAARAAGEAERAMIRAGYIRPGGTPDPEALARDLADPGASNALVDAVRAGRLTRAGAEDLLHNLAVAGRLRDGGETRRAVLRRLPALEDRARAREEVLAALASYDAEAARVWRSVLEDAGVIARASRHEAGAGDLVRPAAEAAWDALVLARIEDEAARDRAREALRGLFEGTEEGVSR